MRDRFYAGVGYVFLSALCFAFLPIFTIFAYRGGINVLTLLLLRFTLASILLVGYILAKSKGSTVFNYLGLLVGLAVLYTVQSITYFVAVKHIPPQLVVLLLYTNPIMVAVLTFLLDKKAISRRGAIASAVSFFGLVLVIGLAWQRIDLWGVVLALISAFFYSLYVVYGNRLVKSVPALHISAFVMVFAALSVGVLGLVTGSIDWKFTPGTWIFVLLIVILSTLLPMLSFFASLPRIGPNKAAVLSMVEPIFAIVLSSTLLDEGLSWLQWLGTLAVLGGALYLVAEPRKTVAVPKRVS